MWIGKPFTRELDNLVARQHRATGAWPVVEHAKVSVDSLSWLKGRARPPKGSAHTNTHSAKGAAVSVKRWSRPGYL